MKNVLIADGCEFIGTIVDRRRLEGTEGRSFIGRKLNLLHYVWLNRLDKEN